MNTSSGSGSANASAIHVRDRLLAAAPAALGMFALPAAVALLDACGPASRVAILPYLPLEGMVTALVALVLGALLGAEVQRLWRRDRELGAPACVAFGAVAGGLATLAILAGIALVASVAPWAAAVPAPVLIGAAALAVLATSCAGGALLHRPVPRARPPWALRAKLAALGLLAAWVAIPHVFAFPSQGSMAERAAWVRAHVPEYSVVERLTATSPTVVAEVGPVQVVAPTGTDRHARAVTMDGVDLRFTLEVVGARGAGTLHLRCVVSDGQVVEWGEGRWASGGRDVPVPAPPLPFAPTRPGTPARP